MHDGGIILFLSSCQLLYALPSVQSKPARLFDSLVGKMLADSLQTEISKSMILA